MLPNGLRYPRVGGMRQRHFDGINFKPRKLLENAATPTRRVHAVLGGFRIQDRSAENELRLAILHGPLLIGPDHLLVDLDHL